MTTPARPITTADTFREALDVFAAALDAAMDQAHEEDPDTWERLDAYDLAGLLGWRVAGGTVRDLMTELTVALDGRDLDGELIAAEA